MDEKRKEIQLQIRRESLKKRIPLVILIIIFFLIYEFLIPLEILKWGSLAVLFLYLGIGMYYRKKLGKKLDEISEKEVENREDIHESGS